MSARYVPDSQSRLWLHLQAFADGTADAEETVTDLLATLRHFCDTHAVDFAERDAMAYRHYLAERSEGYREGWVA